MVPSPFWGTKPLAAAGAKTLGTHLQLVLLGAQSRGRALEVKFFASPDPLLEPSFPPAQNVSSLGLQIFLLINYYASCQISIAITKRLIATMRCGTPLLQGNFLLFMLWHNIAERSGRTAEHKFGRSPSAEEANPDHSRGLAMSSQPSGDVSFIPGRARHPSHLSHHQADPDVHVFLFTECSAGIKKDNLHTKPFYLSL